MKNIILLLFLTLFLFVLISVHTYTMDNRFAGEEDLPRGFKVAEKQSEELN